MDTKNNRVVDVSSFFLFEATGDSESGYFDPAMAVINHDEDDDAESCSCDTSDFVPSVRGLNCLEDKANVDDEDEEDGEVVEQQKEVHVCKKWSNDQRIEVAKEQKSAVSFDSTKSMNEMEKNRLFWETCLAS